MTTSQPPDASSSQPAAQPASDSDDQANATQEGLEQQDYAHLAWLGMDVALAALITTAMLWQQRDGSDVSLEWRTVGFATLFLFINGVRQTFSDVHKARFRRSPIVRAAFSVWLAAFLLMLGWVGGGPLGLYALHVIGLPFMTVVTVLVLALYSSVARGVRQDVAERIAYSALLERAQRDAAIIGAQQTAEAGQTATGRRAGIGQDMKILLWIMGICAAALAVSIAPARHYILKQHVSTHEGDSLTLLDHGYGVTAIGTFLIDGSPANVTSRHRFHRDLPRHWKTGLGLRVKWCRPTRPDSHTFDQPREKGCRWVEKGASIQRYTHADKWLHIFPDDQMSVIASVKAPNHQGYPGPGHSSKDVQERQRNWPL